MNSSFSELLKKEPKIDVFEFHPSRKNFSYKNLKIFFLKNAIKLKKRPKRPTENGEIWLFSENMDQYHPMSLTELSSALGSAIYIWDCCQAGLIVDKFFSFRDNQG